MSRSAAAAHPDVISGTFPVSNIPALILFDTGASLSVISTAFADQAPLVPQLTENTPFTLPSGEIVSCSSVYPDVPILIGEVIFPSTLIRFPLHSSYSTSQFIISIQSSENDFGSALTVHHFISVIH